MTMDTHQHVPTRPGWEHLVDIIRMTMQARFLRDKPVPILDLDRFMKIVGCERERMEEAVVSFGDPLARKVMRQMAVVTGRNTLMTGLRPRIKMRLHNMAVCARSWIVGEVRGALAVTEGERSEPAEDTECDRDPHCE